MTTDWNNLENCLKAAQGKPRCVLKIVVFDDADYSFARTAAARYPMLPVYLQVGNPAPLTGTSTVIAGEPDLEDLMCIVCAGSRAGSLQTIGLPRRSCRSFTCWPGETNAASERAGRRADSFFRM
jgi:hypothetical protein